MPGRSLWSVSRSSGDSGVKQSSTFATRSGLLMKHVNEISNAATGRAGTAQRNVHHQAVADLVIDFVDRSSQLYIMKLREL